MKLPSSTYEFIKGEVANIYKQQNICKFPICATKLAKQMGFTIVPYSELSSKAYAEAIKVSLDGFYAERNWKEYIFVNDSIKIGDDRKRMTIFHEIGHLVLGHSDLVSNDKIKESEAKFFGKYLAAPPTAIHLFTSGENREIKKAFAISDEASCIAAEYYENWRAKVLKSGLAEYDVTILNQLGIKSDIQLERFTKSVREGTSYERQ